MDWIRPAVILGVLVLLIVANVFEFRIKRRREIALLDILREGTSSEQLAVRQYQQTQNIEQLTHVIASTLIAILVALLWR